MTTSAWTISSWRALPALQQPRWPDPGALDETLQAISRLPALVFAGETRSLTQDLAAAVEGNAFVLQSGDCSEDFSRCHGPSIHSLLKVVLQMSIIIAYAGEKRVVRIGRLAGQYAKPRSSDTETIDGVEIPSYRGDMVNDQEPTVAARTPDPRRMLEGYFRAAASLNLVRAFTRGGYAAVDQVRAWHEDFFGWPTPDRKYEDMVQGIRKAMSFMTAMGLDARIPELEQAVIYTSHEALLLQYEEALTRIDTTSGDWYDTSAHMLWIGDRTRQPDGAHVEFLSGVRNPVGVKVGPDHDIDDLKRVLEKLNPGNEPGRLTMITRLGADRIADLLPPLVREMHREGFSIVWSCDPMHGNTRVNEYSRKTREFDVVLAEVRSFYQIHEAEGTIPGGVHLELTGDPVTECLGGSRRLLDRDLHTNYQTSCDPRLNAEQAVEFAFELAETLRPRGRDGLG